MQKNNPLLIDNEYIYDEEVILKSTVLAFDFGEQRIGVAVGEHLIKSASPITTIDNESNEIRFNIITQLVAQWQPKLLLVGLPLNLAGEETPLCQLCKKFARRLNGRFNLPVLLFDERFSSAEASELLNQQDIRGRKQKEWIDTLAATAILQSYFNSLISKVD